MKLSILINHKNRSRVKFENGFTGEEVTAYLFPQCITSIMSTISNSPFDEHELLILDWYSEDWPPDKWVNYYTSIETRVIKQEGRFNRGRGKNRLGELATGRVLFFLDSDMIMDSNLFSIIYDYLVVKKYDYFFPVCRFYLNPSHTLIGEPNYTAVGNVATTNEAWARSPRFPEETTWGKEDVKFKQRLEAVGGRFTIIQEPVAGLYHQYHPTETSFKDKYKYIYSGATQ